MTENHLSVAPQIVWVDDTLKLLFCKGLNPELQSELGCQGEGRNLDQFIDWAIHLDNLICSGRPPRVPPALNISVMEELEPMQIGHTQLTAEERTRRIKH